MTNTQLKTQIDTDITNKTTTKSISPLNVGKNIKDVVDYTVQETTTKELLTNKSTNITTDAASDIKYPTVKAVKTFVDANVGGTKISQEVTADDSVLPDIKDLTYVRIFSSEEGKGLQITGTPIVGKEWYIKNTTAFGVQLFGSGQNINGNNWIMLPANTYWHVIKEDNGTNSITAFELKTSFPETVLQVIKNIKVTLTPFEVSNLFTNPVKVIDRISGKSIKPIQMTVLSNNLTAGYSPNGGQLQLKYEDLPTAILGCSTGLGSFGDTECSNTANSLNAGGYSSLFKHVFVKLASANPVGGDGGLVLYITYAEITL